MSRRDGFTLIELMIVVAIIAVIASIAIPNLLAARLNANETSAIATLRNISSSQSQFQASVKADVDNDGTGEFGLFREMSGGVAVRTNAAGTAVGVVMNPPVLSGSFRALNGNAEVGRSGYLFKMFLPGASGAGSPETVDASAALNPVVDADLAETTWCCYSWPQSFSKSGNRTFFVNQAGDIVATEYDQYDGTGDFAGGQGGRAFKNGGTLGNVTGSVAVGTRGRDGRIWKQIN